MLNLIIAEDNKAIVKNYQSYLAKEEDINIIGVANDGKKALELYNEKHPDLILLDLGLPILGGLEFIEEITKLSEDSDSNIIVISGESNLRLNLFNTKKVYMSLNKPINYDYLKTIIHNYIIDSKKKTFPKEKLLDLLHNLGLGIYNNSSIYLQRLIETAYYSPYLMDNLNKLYNITAIKYNCPPQKIQSSIRSSVRIINKCSNRELMSSIFYISKYNSLQLISPKNIIQDIVNYLAK